MKVIGRRGLCRENRKRSKMKQYLVGRRKPYSSTGIKRIPCARCGKPSDSQWQVCANGNRYQGLCVPCDVKMNALVLKWMKHPHAEELTEIYEHKKLPPKKNAALLAYELAA